MMETFEFMFMNCISERFHKTSKVLEDPQTALSTCSKLCAYLSDFMCRSMTELHITVIIFLQETSLILSFLSCINGILIYILK